MASTAKQGRLELVVGNMFSGKTSELMRRIRRESSINRNVIVISYIHDDRYSKEACIVTHNGDTVRCLKLENLSDIPSEVYTEYDTFFVDEGQFFKDLYVCVQDLVETHKKHVIVAGLDGTYRRTCFGDMVRLIPLCDTIDKLTAYCNLCNDGTEAPFTRKLAGARYEATGAQGTGNGPDSDVVDIGTKDKYIPVCRFHYLRVC